MVISKQYNNCLAGQFDINKTKKLIGCKYYYSSLGKYIEAYIKDCDICFTLKTVKI